MQNFYTDWLLLSERLGFEKDLSEKIGTFLVKKHQEKHRAYHTVGHIEDLLENLDKYAPLTQEIDVLRIVAFFHDAVYDPRRDNNEQQSALLARKYLEQLGFPAEPIEKIAQYIIATQKHAPTGNSDLQLFLDLDLSILGSNPQKYALYAQQIRFEYSHVPALFYRMGRKKVILQFLERKKIFQILPESFEKQARINLQQELKGL